MKKNKMLRIASILLVVTLLSTCVISGTFAKYVTKASGEDQARVAKWGVLVTVGGSAFADKYAAEDEAYINAGGEYSVKAYAEEGETPDQVVAPGTSAEDIDGVLTASVTGRPEVAARYTLEGKGIKDVSLKAGTYTDYTHLVKADDGTFGYTDTFTLENDYSPIKWNLVISKGNKVFNVADELYNALAGYPDLLAKAEALGFSEKGCSFFSAVAILEKVASKDEYKNIINIALGNVVHDGRNFQLEADAAAGTFKMSYDFDPNKDMGFNFELTWEWPFETGEEIEDGIYEFDVADTYLGNVAAGVITDDNACTEISASLIATATQID